MPLHIRGPACRAALPCAVIVRRQAILAFQFGTELPQFWVVIVGVVNGVAGRVDLVDRHVQVKTVGVMVERTDALMRTQSQSLAQARFNGPARGLIDLFAGAKADDQMIGLVGLGAGVAGLGGQYFTRRGLGRGTDAVRHGGPAEPLFFTLRIAQVGDLAGEVAFGNRLHGHVFSDHHVNVAFCR